MIKQTRKGAAGDDVTETKQFQEDVVTTDKDESFVVTDSADGTTEVQTEVIDDQHNVLTPESTGTEEDFLAEAADAAADAEEADTIGADPEAADVESESREGAAEDDKEESEDKEDEEVVMNEDGDTEEAPEDDDDDEEAEEEDRKGSRLGAVYGGKSPEHQSSIKAAVNVAMRNRRL